MEAGELIWSHSMRARQSRDRAETAVGRSVLRPTAVATTHHHVRPATGGVAQREDGRGISSFGKDGWSI
jgi:hypothetical protein